MNPEIAVPLGDGRWIALPQEAFAAALRRAAELGIAPALAAEPATATTEPLVTSDGMAELLSANDTLIEQMAKDKRIPSVRVGRLLRFEPRAVLAALRTNGTHT